MSGGLIASSRDQVPKAAGLGEPEMTIKCTRGLFNRQDLLSKHMDIEIEFVVVVVSKVVSPLVALPDLIGKCAGSSLAACQLAFSRVRRCMAGQAK